MAGNTDTEYVSWKMKKKKTANHTFSSLPIHLLYPNGFDPFDPSRPSLVSRPYRIGLIHNRIIYCSYIRSYYYHHIPFIDGVVLSAVICVLVGSIRSLLFFFRYLFNSCGFFFVAREWCTTMAGLWKKLRIRAYRLEVIFCTLVGLSWERWVFLIPV